MPGNGSYFSGVRRLLRRSVVRRLLQITVLVIKHLGAYLLYTIVKHLWSGLKYRSHHSIFSDISTITRIRFFLQDVDGVFIKIGQIMAMRVDFLPDEHVQELLKLLDEVPPFDPQVAKEIIEAELKSSISDLFRTFDDEPLAAASFGQVHAATLPHGERVVVKVQRPEAPDTIAADMKLLRLSAFLIDATGLTKRAKVKPQFDDFIEWTKEELDYRIEGSHAQKLYDKAKNSKTERVPKIYWRLTTTRVLTLEHLRGIWVKEIIRKLDTDRTWVTKELAKLDTHLTKVSLNIFRNSLRQIFEYNFYHADPHAANLLVMKNGVIGYVDFGIMGRLSEEATDLQVKVHMALESGDARRFYNALLEIVEPPYHANLAMFENTVHQRFDVWTNAQYMGSANIRDKSFARMMLGIDFGARRSGVAFSSMEVRIFRTLAIVDAVLLQFAPSLDARAEFRRFFTAYEAKKLIHGLPARVLAAVSPTKEVQTEVVLTSIYISKVKSFLARSFQILSILLIAAGGAALTVPRASMWLEEQLKIRPLYAGIAILLAIVFFAWLSRMLRLGSVQQRPIAEHRKD